VKAKSGLYQIKVTPKSEAEKELNFQLSGDLVQDPSDLESAQSYRKALQSIQQTNQSLFWGISQITSKDPQGIIPTVVVSGVSSRPRQGTIFMHSNQISRLCQNPFDPSNNDNPGWCFGASFNEGKADLWGRLRSLKFWREQTTSLQLPSEDQIQDLVFDDSIKCP
jgi:hypothetical protein